MIEYITTKKKRKSFYGVFFSHHSKIGFKNCFTTIKIDCRFGFCDPLNWRKIQQTRTICM